MRDMCDAALAGDRETAEAINRRLDPLHRDLFVESNPIPVKWAVAELGLAGRGIRLPLTWLTDDAQPRLRAAMRNAGVIDA